MKITVLSAPDMARLSQALDDALDGRRPDFLSLHLNCAVRPKDLPAARALHGATSCLGAMSHAGFHGGVTGFAITDDAGDYGTAARRFDAEPAFATAAKAASQALRAAGRVGETPELVWVSATPGTEEEVLRGIQSVLGTEVPIIGGSAADNTVEGNWFVLDTQVTTAAGVVVSVLFPSTPISFAYQNGYSPTQNTGVVTKAQGRVVHEIDGRPALDVYADWTKGAIARPASGAAPQPILSDSTLWPLGRAFSELGGVPFYLLAHTAVGHPSGAMELFASVNEGETLTAMTGTADSLIARAGRVADLARKLGPASDAKIAGALMIYCGGCMLSVRKEIGRVVDGANEALGGAPFLGAFTFGEQGPLLGAGNRHGNLMISCIVFHSTE